MQQKKRKKIISFSFYFNVKVKKVLQADKSIKMIVMRNI